MKTKTRNLVISCLLTFVMLISLFTIAPLTAFAQGEITTPTIVSVGGMEVDQETTMGGAPSAMIGQPYSAQVVATGGNLTYSAGAGEYMKLPDGLSIDAETGLISGTCTDEVGRYNCLIKATNTAGEASVVIGITVGDSTCVPEIETAAGTLGETYKDSNTQFMVSATDNSASMSIYNFSWSIKSGALPDGMRLSYVTSRTVYLTGTPTATGTFTFELEAKNDFGTASRTYSISVIEGSVRPEIVASGDSLGYGVVGKPYEYQLEATGTNSNEDPMLWSTDRNDFSQESYDLGNGLSMSKTGLITGTPLTNEQVSFYVYAKNSVGDDGESFYILIHDNGEATSSSITPEVAVVAKGSTKEFTISLEGYGDVEQVAYWSFYMWDDELGSAFPQPTDSELSVNTSTPSKTVTLTVGEDETREQIRVVAYSKEGNNGIKTWATVTIVEKAAVVYNVTFDENGGAGEMASVPVVENGTYELPACGFTAPTGYEFKCWSVNDTEKAVGDEITVNADTIVTAIWEKKAHVHSYDGSYTHNEDAHWKQCSDPACPDLDGSITDTAFCTSAEAVNCVTEGACVCGNTIFGEHDFENGITVKHDEEYHVGKCAYCNATNSDYSQHTGGTATCTAKAKCSVCNTEYGALAAHTPNEDDGNCTTAVICSVCEGVTTEAKTAHSDENSDGKCDLCNKDMPTSGGGTGGTTPDPIPNPTPDTTPDPDDEKDGLSGGAIAGIVVGSTAVAGAGGFSAVWFGVKKKTFGDLKNVCKKLGKKITKKLAKKAKKAKHVDTPETTEIPEIPETTDNEG